MEDEEKIDYSVNYVLSSLSHLSDRGVMFLSACHSEKFTDEDFEVLVGAIVLNFSDRNDYQINLANKLISNLGFIRDESKRTEYARNKIEKAVIDVLRLSSYEPISGDRLPDFKVNLGEN